MRRKTLSQSKPHKIDIKLVMSLLRDSPEGEAADLILRESIPSKF